MGDEDPFVYTLWDADTRALVIERAERGRILAKLEAMGFAEDKAREMLAKAVESSESWPPAIQIAYVTIEAVKVR